MLKDNTDAAIADLKELLSTMGFLSKGYKLLPDVELVEEIQGHMDSLRANQGAVFETTVGGNSHEPSASELATWLFSGMDGQRLTIRARPTTADEELVLTISVPVIW